MIDRSHPLPITRQAEIVHISRGSVYCEAEPRQRGGPQADATHR